jgi:hypothetical protein
VVKELAGVSARHLAATEAIVPKATPIVGPGIEGGGPPGNQWHWIGGRCEDVTKAAPLKERRWGGATTRSGQSRFGFLVAASV